MKHSNYLKLKGCGHHRRNSLLELQGTCSTNQHFFEATSTGSFHGVRIPSAIYRWPCSKTDKSNCCSHETRFSGATCGFRRRDAVNYALNSRVGKTPHQRLQPVWFLLAFILLFMHQDLLERISILFIRHNPLGQFCLCVTFIRTNFQFCPFITILLTTFVRASRSSGRIFYFVPSITILMTTFVRASRSSGRIFFSVPSITILMTTFVHALF